ncbi:kinase-like protein [Hesseltinella vesiculosa]|uniref:Kinase-like protein n=1 Tax=Hesseltinella vesiculosa TaxID=101127 RepID=A0A1X2GV10_9FUNG|nr:kinase-like protein [Hesseltinella vesiculosa]
MPQRIPLSQLLPLYPAGHLIDHRYEVQRSIGAGAYAQVYLAKDLLDKNKPFYAIKALPSCVNNAKQRGLQRSEIGLHGRVTSHPHIIRLEKVLRSQDQFLTTHMVLEYGCHGDLFTAITEKHLYTNQRDMIRHAFLQLIAAVQHCHRLGVYHRDLKSENILVFDAGWTVKIADFGLATTDVISKDYGCGSTFYFSPECQGDFDTTRQGYLTAPNDVWSLGIILINLVTGRNPWHCASLRDPTFRMYLMNPDILISMLPISTPLHCILKRVLAIDPLKRMTLDELDSAIRHCQFFTDVDEITARSHYTGLPSPPISPNHPHFPPLLPVLPPPLAFLPANDLQPPFSYCTLDSTSHEDLLQDLAALKV